MPLHVAVPLQIGAVADIHGNFDALTRAMNRHPDVPVWICVGDLASRSGAYPEPPRPLYWIKGNNEDFDLLARWDAGEPLPHHLHFIPNGTAVDIPLDYARGAPLDDARGRAVRVAGLGGTYAPTWFDTPVADLPSARRAVPFEKRDDKRRHFVRDEVEACKRLERVDILMTHEAARPFILVDEPRPGRTPRRRDAGKRAINDLLATLRPRLHLCGHHHRFSETRREGVSSVCIDRINRSYLLIDAATLDYHKVDQ